LSERVIFERLANTTGETCGIAIPDGTEMIYFDRVQSNWPLQIYLPVGSRTPLWCTSSGKLYLSSLPREQRPLEVDEQTLHGKSFYLLFLKGFVPPVFLISLVLGSIFGGWATPTEAAGIGAFGALVLAGFKGKLSKKLISETCQSSGILPPKSRRPESEISCCHTFVFIGSIEP